MKIVLTLPASLVSAADRMAGQLNVSRSELYAQALAEYVDDSREAAITQRLNAVYGAAREGLDPALGPAFGAAQAKAIGTEAW